MNAPVAANALLAPWPGRFGGLPPFDKADPASIGAAYEAALALKRAEVRAIAADPAPPTFDNAIAALEDSGRALKRVACLLGAYAWTMSSDAMREVERRLAPLAPALDDEIAHDDALIARIEAVDRASATLTREQARVTRVILERLRRRGAGLDGAAKARLLQINARLSELQSRFNQNLIAEQDAQVLFFDSEADLDGLGDDRRADAAAAAAAKGRPGKWAVPNSRPSVWPFLQRAKRRDLREQVWRQWVQRCVNPGPHDNRPVVAEVLRLRGEKARLLGYASFAHFALADRMARTPDTALDLLRRVWDLVIDTTREQLTGMQAIADADGVGQLEPWDRYYYAEKLRQARFGLDGDEVREYLPLESIREASFWAAGRLHGVEFVALPDAPVCHPSVRVYEVRRGGETLGLLWYDVLQRPGKMAGSWQDQYRAAESFNGRVLPISAVVSSIVQPPDGGPPLLTWEVASVLFHELGHALHMLSCKASYPSIGSLETAWDFIELPSLLNERWLRDRELLRRFARHHRTGEPMPDALIDKIERAERADRSFSVTLDFLGSAIVDMKLHLLADGRDIDALAVEAEVLAELEQPSAVEPTLRVPHSVHLFVSSYAAGLYSYTWADVMAADAAEAFVDAPGGFYDAPTAERWRRSVLEVGHSVPAEQAFRDFRGRDPDPQALLRRFGLEATA